MLFAVDYNDNRVHIDKRIVIKNIIAPIVVHL